MNIYDVLSFEYIANYLQKLHAVTDAVLQNALLFGASKSFAQSPWFAQDPQPSVF